VLVLTSVASVASECRPDVVELRGTWGRVRFNVEIADDQLERSRGLMFRESMSPNAGMLFIYDQPQHVRFWMKNTLISLDMLFLDRHGVVTRLHKHAIPGDPTSIFGGNEIFAVLEINGGLTDHYGITVGSQMRHPAFSDGPAIWPC